MSESMYNITTGMRDRGSKRSKVLVWNILTSFLVKGWTAVVMLMMIPLTLRCLGSYQNGVWLTISSILVWIDYMDIGLGNGLRNKLAVHLAHGEMKEAQCAVSSTMAMLLCVIIPILFVLLLLIWHTDVYVFLNASPTQLPELRRALTCGVTLVCATFVLKFIGNVYMGLQLPVVNNILTALGQTIALIATWILFTTGNANFLNIVAVNTAAPLLVYFLAFPYTFWGRYPSLSPSLRYIKLNKILELGNLGIKFFFLQLAGIIQFMTANLLISKFFTPELVTPYQIAYRYISLAMVIFTIICMPFWSATTDAYERGDMRWIQSANKKMNWIMTGLILLMIVMVMISPIIYRIWIGDVCQVLKGMTLMMAVYVFLIISSSRYSYFLSGIGALRIQLYMWVMPIAFIPLAWFVSNQTHSIYWFMAVMCFCIMPSVIVYKIQLNKIIKGTAKGIWEVK